MYHLKYLSLFFVSFIYSGFLYAADFDEDTCGVLNSNSDFSVYFEINDADLEETVWVDKGVGGGKQEQIALWTDDPSVENESEYVIKAGPEIEEDGDYKLLLTYEAAGNKTGLVTYYLWSSGSWQYISEETADLSSLNSVNIKVDGDDIEELSCSEGLEPPGEIPDYSLNALYEFGTAQCNLTNGTSCTIPFTQDYTIAPLVFVMPTIDTVEPDEDKPATLYISSDVTADSTSVQITKDTVDLSEMDNDVAITEVSYLIIEPGVADFNGHTVVAGYVNTDAENSKSDSGSSAEVNYSDFGFNDSLSSPVVLHQLQTRNNGDKWMTSGKLGRTDSSSVRLFFELSASKDDDHNYVEEKIAFIATEAVSALQVGNYNVEFQRGFRNPSQTGNDPMNDACTKGYADVGLDRVDGIIGKKQERRGGHGGWTRRCEIKDSNQVSFVIDEDFSNRGHLQEELGYFAFEQKRLDIDYCEYFPEPAQSWKALGQLNLRSSGITIEGWSADYELNYLDGDTLGVPFEGTENANSEYHLTESCITSEGEKDCVLSVGGSPPLVSVPINLTPDWGTLELIVDNSNFSTVCDEVEECETNEAGGIKTLTILDSMLSLRVSAYGGEITVEFAAKTGDYGVSIESYLSDGAVNNYFNANSSYTFGTFNYSGTGATMSTETGVVLNIVSSYSQSNAVPFTDVDSTRDLIIYGPQASITFRTQDNNDIIAQVLADTLEFTNKSVLRGAATSNNLIFNVSGSQIIGEGACLTPPPSDDYELRLTPSIDISLTCEVVEATATIYKNGSVDTSYGGTVYFEVDGTQVGSTNAVSGVATFDVNSTEVKTASVRAYTTPSSDTVEDTASYEFVPYLLDITPSPLGVIANHPEDIEIRPLECSSGGSPISSTKYEGVTDVALSNLSYSLPSNPDNKASLSLLNHSDVWVDVSENSTTTTTLEFKVVSGEVVAESQIRYPESGQISYSLSSDYCIDDGEGGQLCETSTGSQEIQSRPWTFALCSSEDDTTIAGTATGGNGYLASGEQFDVQVVPIVWDGSGAISGPIDTTNLCGETVTQNFFMTSAPTAKVVMSHAVDTPSGGVMVIFRGCWRKTMITNPAPEIIMITLT
ncbi:DUF6701 domain-containing protein [Vibrio mexicanus]|uniref:DUF6701 domain-containing protein n=1 Tax=Vibrio mexicanus TaxID=1004326 RepID=UPI00069C054E|nr:DUF6701 domain-containing protein [Vibrio mexicanus]